MEYTKRKFLLASGLVGSAILGYSRNNNATFVGGGSIDSNIRFEIYDPFGGGIAISSNNIDGYGTLGSCVLDENGNPSLLTSRHLVDSEFCEEKDSNLIGEMITDVEGNEIAEVTQISNTGGTESNDWLIAQLSNESLYSNAILGIDEIGSIQTVSVNDRIVMSGYNTGLIGGKVTDVNLSTNITGCLIGNIIEYEIDGNVNTNGNSGAIVGKIENSVFHPIGIHTFGGSDSKRYAMDINAIVQNSGLEFDKGNTTDAIPNNSTTQVEAALINESGDILVSNLDTQSITTDIVIQDSNNNTVKRTTITLNSKENRIINMSYQSGYYLKTEHSVVQLA